MTAITNDTVITHAASHTATEETVAKKTVKAKSSEQQENVMYALMYVMAWISTLFTDTMQLQQQHYQQLTQEQAGLKVPQWKKGENTNKFKTDQMNYQAELGDVENQEQITSTSLNATASNDTTVLSQLMKVSQNIGQMFTSVVQAWQI